MNSSIYHFAQILLSKVDYSISSKEDMNSSIKLVVDKGDTNSMLIFTNTLNDSHNNTEDEIRLSVDNGNSTSMNIYSRMLFEGNGVDANIK